MTAISEPWGTFGMVKFASVVGLGAGAAARNHISLNGLPSLLIFMPCFSRRPLTLAASSAGGAEPGADLYSSHVSVIAANKMLRKNLRMKWIPFRYNSRRA